MKENIYEQLNFELDVQLDLINKKKAAMTYLWITKHQQNFSDEENENIICSMVSIGTAKNQKELKYYANNALSYVEELLS